MSQNSTTTTPASTITPVDLMLNRHRELVEFSSSCCLGEDQSRIIINHTLQQTGGKFDDGLVIDSFLDQVCQMKEQKEEQQEKEEEEEEKKEVVSNSSSATIVLDMNFIASNFSPFNNNSNNSNHNNKKTTFSYSSFLSQLLEVLQNRIIESNFLPSSSSSEGANVDVVAVGLPVSFRIIRNSSSSSSSSSSTDTVLSSWNVRSSFVSTVEEMNDKIHRQLGSSNKKSNSSMMVILVTNNEDITTLSRQLILEEGKQVFIAHTSMLGSVRERIFAINSTASWNLVTDLSLPLFFEQEKDSEKEFCENYGDVFNYSCILKSAQANLPAFIREEREGEEADEEERSRLDQQETEQERLCHRYEVFLQQTAAFVKTSQQKIQSTKNLILKNNTASSSSTIKRSRFSAFGKIVFDWRQDANNNNNNKLYTLVRLLSNNNNNNNNETLVLLFADQLVGRNNNNSKKNKLPKKGSELFVIASTLVSSDCSKDENLFSSSVFNKKENENEQEKEESGKEDDDEEDAVIFDDDEDDDEIEKLIRKEAGGGGGGQQESFLQQHQVVNSHNNNNNSSQFVALAAFPAKCLKMESYELSQLDPTVGLEIALLSQNSSNNNASRGRLCPRSSSSSSTSASCSQGSECLFLHKKKQSSSSSSILSSLSNTTYSTIMATASALASQHHHPPPQPIVAASAVAPAVTSSSSSSSGSSSSSASLHWWVPSSSSSSSSSLASSSSASALPPPPPPPATATAVLTTPAPVVRPPSFSAHQEQEEQELRKMLTPALISSTTVNVEGDEVPLVDLEKTKFILFILRNPTARGRWCEFWPNCKSGRKCMYAHPKNDDDDDEDNYTYEDLLKLLEPSSEPGTSTAEGGVTKNSTPPMHPVAPAPASQILSHHHHLLQHHLLQQHQHHPIHHYHHHAQHHHHHQAIPHLHHYQHHYHHPQQHAGGGYYYSQQLHQHHHQVLVPSSTSVTSTTAAGSLSSSSSITTGASEKDSRTLNVEGILIPYSELDRTSVFDFAREHPGNQAKWCVHQDICNHGEFCGFAHRRRLGQLSAEDTVPHVALRSDQLSTIVNIEGRSVPISHLEPTKFVEFIMTAPESTSGKWCAHWPLECKSGHKCKYAHKRVELLLAEGVPVSAAASAISAPLTGAVPNPVLQQNQNIPSSLATVVTTSSLVPPSASSLNLASSSSSSSATTAASTSTSVSAATSVPSSSSSGTSTVLLTGFTVS